MTMIMCMVTTCGGFTGIYLRNIQEYTSQEVLSLTDVKKKGSRQDTSPVFSLHPICILYTTVGLHVD